MQLEKGLCPFKYANLCVCVCVHVHSKNVRHVRQSSIFFVGARYIPPLHFTAIFHRKIDAKKTGGCPGDFAKRSHLDPHNGYGWEHEKGR